MCFFFKTSKQQQPHCLHKRFHDISLHTHGYMLHQPPPKETGNTRSYHATLPVPTFYLRNIYKHISTCIYSEVMSMDENTQESNGQSVLAGMSGMPLSVRYVARVRQSENKVSGPEHGGCQRDANEIQRSSNTIDGS